MRFLIDNNLSVKLTDALARLGHDAMHVRQVGLGAASDSDFLSWAEKDQRIVVSGDRDFGTLLAALRATQPSVVYVKGRVARSPEPLAILLDRNLRPLEQPLREGRIVVLETGPVRVRELPIE